MSVKTKVLASKLTSKFGYEPTGGTNHEGYELVIDGVKVATTRLPRSGKEVRPQLLGRIAKQMYTNSSSLRRMCACEISRDEYIARLDRHGKLK